MESLAIRRNGVVAEESHRLVFALALVRGQLWGEADRQSLRALPISAGQLPMPWAELEPWAQAAALPWRSGESIRVEPAAVEITRVLPVAYRPQGGGQYTVGFVDLDREVPLTLVYVDRPVQVLGARRLLKERVLVDVSLPAAGFHWLALADGALTKAEPRSVAIDVRKSAAG